MKKSILRSVIAIAAMMSAFAVSAQTGYRGFVDAELGASLNPEEDIAGFAGGVTSVHGYQSGHSFFGVGLGILAQTNTHIDKKVTFPIFAQYRYDYSLISKHSFYCMARAGYAATDGAIAGIGGGVRFATKYSGITAFNLGLNITYTYSCYFNLHNGRWWDQWHSINYIPALTFGIEF